MASDSIHAVIDDVSACCASQDGGAHANRSRDITDACRLDSEAAMEWRPSPTVFVGDDIVTPLPLFASDVEFDCNCANDIMFCAPKTPSGSATTVYRSCCYGVCHCEYYLDGFKSQLLPCRFAYLLYGGFISNDIDHKAVYEGVCGGFKIVESEVAPYDCRPMNYSSILSDENKPIMDKLVEKELAEDFITKVVEKPTCIHAMGAIPKGPSSIRLITDCSRPTGVSVNAHCGVLARKFCYNTVRDVVSGLTPGCYLSVIDIQSASMAVKNTL